MNENKKPDENIIAMIGDCQILAAIAEEGKAPKKPTVEMNAYNGGKINVGYWGSVVVDVSGMKASDSTPILYGHNIYNIDGVLGQTSKVTLENGITATGIFTGNIEDQTTVLGKVILHARNGYKFQVSMGATPLKSREIAEGESVEANGQTFEGPFTLIMESKLNEVSILPLGADDTTNAAIAAGLQTTKEGHTMAKDNEVKTAEEIRAEAAALASRENERINAVKEVAKDHPAIIAQAIKDGWDSSKTRISVLEAQIKDRDAQIEAGKVQGDRPPPFNVQNPSVLAGAITAESIQASVCLQAGLKDPEKSFSADILNKSGDVKCRTITEMVRASLALDGKVLEATRHDTRQFIEAAFSTVSIANIVGATVNKFMRQGYGTVEQAWREVAAVRSVVDFKANTGVRLIMDNLLKALAPTGEIQHGDLSDSARTITADTKALMFGITRKDIINDDLSVLSDLPTRLGYASARTFCTDFWAALEAAVGANFTGALGNTTTGALTFTTLAAAELLHLALKDADGNPIGVGATKLLCGGTAYAAARELFMSSGYVGGSTKAPATNIYAQQFKPVFSSYLSTLPWYLTGDPMAVPLMEVAFLNGVQEPVVESAAADFNKLGIQIRCVYDYGVAFAERQGTVYSTGA